MRAIEVSSPAQVKVLLPAHRRMVTNMLSAIDGDIRRLQVPDVSGLRAIRDSVRRDLAKLPTLPAEELRDAMPAHDARVSRLMQMHAALTKKKRGPE